jgi:hypothetical protein
MGRSFFRRSTRLGLEAALLVGVVAGAAHALTGSSPATINACEQSVSGNIRIVPSAGGCRTNETALSWNTEGPTGPQGPSGATGPQGDTGAPGPAASVAITQVATQPQVIPAHQTTFLYAVCPADAVAISGGFSLADNDPPLYVKASVRYAQYPQQWEIDVENPGAEAGVASAFAYCAKTS